jgi:hypothetical protein
MNSVRAPGLVVSEEDGEHRVDPGARDPAVPRHRRDPLFLGPSEDRRSVAEVGGPAGVLGQDPGLTGRLSVGCAWTCRRPQRRTFGFPGVVVELVLRSPGWGHQRGYGHADR